MQNTTIEWTDHTLNFWWGCTKVSPACTHCYAEQVAKVFGKRLFGTTPTWGAGQPRFQRLEAARKEAIKLNKKPRICTGCGYVGPERTVECPKGCGSTTWRRHRVFVNSMSDWLDPEVPIEWLAYLLETIHLCPHLDFQLLTKRPENWRTRLLDVWALEYKKTRPGGILSDVCQMTSRWANADFPQDIPENVWIGTTVEDQTRADQRIPHLLDIPAKVRFLSCEPLLGPVNLSPLLPLSSSPLLHWIIGGGESGAQARPTHPDWFVSLRDQCAAASVPFFFKQWGEFIPAGAEAAHLPQNRTFKSTLLESSLSQDPKTHERIIMLRAGTDLTGRLLEGRLHDQFPKV